jgi:predicted nucleic acid-binding protein
MADAIILATAEFHKANLITSDSHFAGLPGVTLF